jgi:hypothetical protein
VKIRFGLVCFDLVHVADSSLVDLVDKDMAQLNTTDSSKVWLNLKHVVGEDEAWFGLELCCI